VERDTRTGQSGGKSFGKCTLRKWAGALEESGYTFAKNEQGHRLYVERDIVILRQFKKLVQETNMPLENAANLVVDRASEHPLLPVAGGALNGGTIDQRSFMRSEDVNNRILDRLERQEEFNYQLLNELQRQREVIEQLQKYIHESLERRDQQLLASLRETQETKKLLLEQKQQEEERQKKRRGFFRRFFGG
jgi:DNA-binding transcriptional MerR regulator